MITKQTLKIISGLLMTFLLFTGSISAQVTVKGKILDHEKEPIIGANVVVKNSTLGTATDLDGAFSLEIPGNAPQTLTISYLGFETKDVILDKLVNEILVSLVEENAILTEVVVSASRVEEKILESPVTIEKMDPIAIKQSSSNDYYDDLSKLKGVTSISGSMTLTSINTRGFGGISNTRFVQLMDGMDNAAPLLNFPSGNVVGIGELDIHDVELVPGAASALYGPNAFNGILLMNSKNPFEYQGLSLQGKLGFSYSNAADGADPMYTIGVRYAKAFKEKFAFKVNASYFGGTDWRANDYVTDRNTGKKNMIDAPNFDGMNTYGDENRIFIPFSNPAVAGALTSNIASLFKDIFFGGDSIAASEYLYPRISALNPIDIRRTGLKEEDLLDNNKATSLKGDISLNYRPAKDWEISLGYRVGQGNAVYQGSERYALRNFVQHYAKFEVSSKQLMIRSYMSQTNDGDSYNLTALGAYTNEAFSDTRADWALNYAGYYTAVNMALLYLKNPAETDPNTLSQDVVDFAHEIGRMIASEGFPEPGSPAFDSVVNSVRNGLFQQGGAGFIDHSRLFHTEGTYDFTKLCKDKISILVGANHRQYSLFTDGTVFNEDPEGTGVNSRIKINEYGTFLQIGKKFFDDRWKLQASVRYDKNENFKGIFSPRVSSVVTLGDKRNHNIRASYQTGFRNPDSQAQYIFFPTTNILLGGTRENAERYGIYEGGAYSAASYDAFVAAQLSGVPIEDALKLLEVEYLDYIKPEKLTAVELGYKAAVKKFVLDVNGYFNIYEDFITQSTVVSIDSTTHKGKTLYGVNDVLAGRASSAQTWRPYVNVAGTVWSWGSAIGMSYRLPKNYVLSGNYSYIGYKAEENVDINDLGFNTPNHRFVVGIGNKDCGYNIGFDVSFNWQSEIAWSSDFASGIVPSRSSLDAQISYMVPKAKTVFKLGTTNLAGVEYRTNVGGPFIGRTFYVGMIVDGLFSEPKNNVQEF